jgi:glycosyltransferase involved in cell wall biosynthesis
MHGSANALVKAKNKLFRFKLLQYMWETVRKKNIENATRIIAIDPLCLNLTKKLKQEGKTILLPNFVDTRIFYKDDTSCQLLEHIQEKILLFIGRIEEVKGLELFVDTLLNINKKEPGDWKGVFIGRGTYEPVVKKYIAALSATDLFFFAGPVFEQADLRKVYNRASLLMISSHFEGIPMVILESMACGTPVISTDVGGIKELIADNKMCYVNGRRDPAEFAELAISILKGKEAMMDEIKYSSSGASEIINEIFINKS